MPGRKERMEYAIDAGLGTNAPSCIPDGLQEVTSLEGMNPLNPPQTPKKVRLEP